MMRRAALFSNSGLTSAGVIDGQIQDDWPEIASICEAGLASKFYSIGDYKELDLGEGGIQRMCIIAFNRDTSPEAVYTTTFLSADLVQPVLMTAGQSYGGGILEKIGRGWGHTPQDGGLEDHYENNILPLVPSSLRDRIKPVFKFYAVSGGKTLSAKLAKIWPPEGGEFLKGSNADFDDLAQRTFYPEYCDFIANGGEPQAIGKGLEFVNRVGYAYVNNVYLSVMVEGDIRSYLFRQYKNTSPHYEYVMVKPSHDLGFCLGFCL